jgi:methionyl-tRNA formyltransferase
MMWGERRLQIFDARKRLARSFAAVRGKNPGQIVTVTREGIAVMAQDGLIEVLRCCSTTARRSPAARPE